MAFIKANLRTARVAAKLQKRTPPLDTSSDRVIPLETANAIIDEVKKASPQSLPIPAVAQQALRVYETVNARPPGWAQRGWWRAIIH